MMSRKIFYIKVTKLFFITNIFVFMASNNLRAQEVDIKQLIEKINILENKVTQLEGRLAMKEHIGPEKGTAAVPYSAPKTEGLVKTLEDIHLGGYVSTLYDWNSRNPLLDSDGATVANPAPGVASGNGNNTNLRAFDRDANSFVNNAKLVMEKPAVEMNAAGFRSDLIFGRDAQILSNATAGDALNNIFVEQAYIQYIAPLGKGLDIKAGRFVTIAGAEVIESKDNWNSSRSLLFNNAIPFTHNGILVSYKFNDLFDAKLGITNGWDSSIDNNRSKTLLSGFGLHLLRGLDLNNAFLIGPEQARTVGGANTEKNLRGLWDSVLAWTPIQSFDRWKLLLNYDYGWEEKVAFREGSGNSIWHGLAFGTKYDAAKWLSLSGRWEYFADPHGVRTAGLNGLTPVQDMVLYEMTYTADFKLTPNLITRLEYRYDQSDENIFDLSNGLPVGAAQSQQTIGSELIYLF